jgi:hypothetical protein
MAYVTKIVILIATIIILLYDGYVWARYGSDSTVSCVILKLSMQYPFVPFAAGVLCGHLFAPIRITNK